MASKNAVLGLMCVVLSACAPSEEQNIQTKVSSAVTTDPIADLSSRCIDAALDEGYIDGQCAFTFIDACVKTQSKTEMARIVDLQRTFGGIRGVQCPNPSTYAAQFQRRYATR